MRKCTGLFFLAFPLYVLAQSDLKPALVLQNIKQIKSQEENDEIYFSVSDLGAKEKKFYTVPGHFAYFPKPRAPRHTASNTAVPHPYWRAEALGKVKNVTLWSRLLQANQSAQLMVSLVESDMAPWNLDDTLGTFKLDLRNKKNKVECKFISYSHVQLKSKKKVEAGTQFVVDIKGEEAEYVITVLLRA